MYEYKLFMTDWDRETLILILTDAMVEDVIDRPIIPAKIFVGSDHRITLHCEDWMDLQSQVDLLARCQQIQDQTRDLVTSETFIEDINETT